MALNTNTRILVQRVFGSTEGFRRVKRAVDAVLGRLATTVTEQQAVAQALRKIATTITNAFGADPALHDSVQRLQELNAQCPSRADINGMLGWVYKRMGQLTDARDGFRRSLELGTKEVHVFWHWSDLEARQNEWSEAIRVAELGCKAHPSDAGLHQQLGYCLSRYGQEAMKEGDDRRAMHSCKRAEASLCKAAELLNASERPSVRGKLFRALVLNAHSLRDGAGVNRYLLEWRQVAPHDATFEFEYNRLRELYPEHVKHADQLAVPSRTAEA